MKKAILLLVLCFFCSGMLRAESNCNFIGNKKSKKYHTNTCRMVPRMNEKNRVCFVSSGEAEALGYIACKICKPNKGYINVPDMNKAIKNKTILLAGKES